MDSAGERVLARLAEALLEPGVHVVLRVEPLDLDARVGEAARVLRPHDRGDGRLLLGSVGPAGEGYGAAASRAPRRSAHAAAGAGGGRGAGPPARRGPRESAGGARSGGGPSGGRPCPPARACARAPTRAGSAWASARGSRGPGRAGGHGLPPD